MFRLMVGSGTVFEPAGAEVTIVGIAERWIAVGLGAALAWSSASALADPPGRVGRISFAAGDVVFQSAHTGESEAAQVNWPVTARNVISTGADGRAEVRIGSTAVRLDRDSELEFSRLDDEHIRVRLLAGRMMLRVKSRDNLQEFEVRTPHGRALFEDVGRYQFDTRGERDSTGLTVYQGAARFDFAERSILILSGRRAEVWGALGAMDARVMAAFRDEFDDWSLARDRRDDHSRSVRYVSQDMTGYDELDEHGEWREIPEHGAVWIPHMNAVPEDWAPYRWGRWAWVDPWGWTWIDSAPWGFAPFHYGRWVHHHGSWAWAPGAIGRRPVYAPALVGWVGRPGAAVSTSFGPSVGWFPLAPREVYYPAYPCTPLYVQRMNITHAHNIGAIQAHHGGTPNSPRRYHHASIPHAVTLVPEGVLAGGRPVTPRIAMARDPKTIGALPMGDSPTMHAPARPVPGQTHARPSLQPAQPTQGAQPWSSGGHRGLAEPARHAPVTGFQAPPSPGSIQHGPGQPQFVTPGRRTHAGQMQPQQGSSVPGPIGGVPPAPSQPITPIPMSTPGTPSFLGSPRQGNANPGSSRMEHRHEPPRIAAPIAIQQTAPMQPLRVEPPRQIAAPRIEAARPIPQPPVATSQPSPQGGARGEGHRAGHPGQPGQPRRGPDNK
ncbi:MAG: DUF6600 domain-containing protein [Burkholderiales bacterium]